MIQATSADFSFGMTREIQCFPSTYGSSSTGLSYWDGRARVHTVSSLPMLRVPPSGLPALQKSENFASQTDNSHPQWLWMESKGQLNIFSLNTFLSKTASKTNKSLLGICRQPRETVLIQNPY